MTSFIDDITNFGSDAFSYITDTDDGLLDDVAGFFQTSDGTIDYGIFAGGLGRS